MRKIIGSVFLSLDGVMQAPGGPTEDPRGDFKFGGWIPPHSDEITSKAVWKIIGGDYDLLLGKKTYEIFAAYWPYFGDDNPVARPFNRVKKYVLTSKNDALEWNNSHRIANLEELKKIKAGNGPDLLIQGSSTLYPQLFSENLVDRLTILTFPVVLGRGRRLFGEGTPPFAMRMVSSEVSTTGVTIATYEPSGKVPVGTFLNDNPSEAELRRRERWAQEG